MAGASGERTVIAAAFPAAEAPQPAHRVPTVVLDSAGTPPIRRAPRLRPWLVAAAVIVVALLGGLAWRTAATRAASGVERPSGLALAPRDLDDVRRALRRTTDLLAAGQPMRARAAYREAQAALLTYRKRHDDPASLRRLDAITAEFRRQANTACMDARSRARTAAAAAQFPCVPAATSQGRGRRQQ